MAARGSSDFHGVDDVDAAAAAVVQDHDDVDDDDDEKSIVIKIDNHKSSFHCLPFGGRLASSRLASLAQPTYVFIIASNAFLIMMIMQRHTRIKATISTSGLFAAGHDMVRVRVRANDRVAGRDEEAARSNYMRGFVGGEKAPRELGTR